MPDSLPGLFWLCFQAGRPARLEAAELLGSTVDEAKVDIGEAHDPVARLGLGDADELTDEGFADEDEVATPFDLAIGTHPAHGMVGVIPGILHPGRIGPGRRAIAAGRWVLIESLMGPDIVKSWRKCSNRACCSTGLAAGGREVSALSVPCMRS